MRGPKERDWTPPESYWSDVEDEHEDGLIDDDYCTDYCGRPIDPGYEGCLKDRCEDD